LRVWDLPPELLCRPHLLGEHRELHAVWTIITQGRQGYSHHPEVKRWRGKLRALYLRHDALVREMEARGYQHASALDEKLAQGAGKQDVLLESLERQRELLRGKGCTCRV